MKLDFLDHQIIECLVELPSKLSQLSSSEANILFNKDQPVRKPELEIKLKKLVAEGYLDWRDSNGNKKSYFNEMSKDDVFCLTTNGGAKWEEKNKPNWEFFLLEEFEYIDNYIIKVLVGSPSKDSLIKYLNPLESKIIFHIKKVSPWEAFYWKQFDTGHIASFEINEKEYETLIPDKSSWQMKFKGEDS